MRRTALLLLLGLAAASAIPLAAQTTPALAEGQLLRIRAPGVWRGRTQATFIAWSGDTLIVREMRSRGDAPLVRVPPNALERLEVGHRRSRGEGAFDGLWIGALNGALFGGAVGFVTDEGGMRGRRQAAGLFALVGFGAGIVVGPVVGALAPGHRWTRVQLPHRVGLIPIGNDAVGIVVTIPLY